MRQAFIKDETLGIYDGLLFLLFFLCRLMMRDVVNEITFRALLILDISFRVPNLSFVTEGKH